MVSTASCAPPQSGSPFAMTSMRRSSRRSGWMLRSRTRTLQATVAPASRLTRAAARSKRSPREHKMPEREQAARWKGSPRRRQRQAAASRGKGKRSRRSNKALSSIARDAGRCQPRDASSSVDRLVGVCRDNGRLQWQVGEGRRLEASVAEKVDSTGEGAQAAGQ